MLALGPNRARIQQLPASIPWPCHICHSRSGGRRNRRFHDLEQLLKTVQHVPSTLTQHILGCRPASESAAVCRGRSQRRRAKIGEHHPSADRQPRLSFEVALGPGNGNRAWRSRRASPDADESDASTCAMQCRLAARCTSQHDGKRSTRQTQLTYLEPEAGALCRCLRSKARHGLGQ